MLVEQVNRLDLEPPERGVHDLLDVLWRAVQPALLAAVPIEAELGGDDHLPAKRREGLAEELFVGERPVDFGGVEAGDAEFDGLPHQGDHLLSIGSLAVSTSS